MEKLLIARKKVAAALRLMPGLGKLLDYRREWLGPDAVAGVSVAAVALPTAIAYAELIGFEPVVGLYAAILPMLVYAIFGTSRHLVVNPDAATCAIVGTTLMPLAAGHSNSLMSLSIALAVFTGILWNVRAFRRHSETAPSSQPSNRPWILRLGRVCRAIRSRNGTFLGNCNNI